MADLTCLPPLAQHFTRASRSGSPSRTTSCCACDPSNSGTITDNPYTTNIHPSGKNDSSACLISSGDRAWGSQAGADQGHLGSTKRIGSLNFLSTHTKFSLGSDLGGLYNIATISPKGLYNPTTCPKCFTSVARACVWSRKSNVHGVQRPLLVVPICARYLRTYVWAAVKAACSIAALPPFIH